MDNPVAMIDCTGQNDVWYYYYADALGSIRLITDAAGAPVESYTYDVYGRPRVMTAAGDGNWLTEDVGTTISSSIGNPYMFTGRRWDSYSQLYYYRFRDYAPKLGRFVQTDPAKYIDTMNLYAYCGNNPVNWIDPWGLRSGRPVTGNFWTDFGNALHDEFIAPSDGVRGYVGLGVGATGGSLMFYAACASNPPGWVLGTGVALFSVGTALGISDYPAMAEDIKNAVKPIDELQKEREKTIDELDDLSTGGKGTCPDKGNGT